MQSPIKVMVLSTIENFEEFAGNLGKEKSPLALSGNALESEYIGKTGRTVAAEFAILKSGWKATGDITPDDGSIDFDELYKFE
jgi:hydrogenase maturation factor HypF (carbamoyltransferase family)